MDLQQMKGNIHLPSVEQTERIVDLLDKGVRMPILPIRLPLDPILGVIPGIGDVVTLAISGSIILRARELGVPPSMQRRMVTYAVADCICGCVPFLGDVFDFFYKANRKNLGLLKKHLASVANEEGSP